MNMMMAMSMALLATTVGSPSAVPSSFGRSAISPTCSNGDTPIPLVGSARTPTGSIVYSYAASGGLTFTQTAPPRDFNPLTASVAALREAGFPPRPSSKAVAAVQTDWADQVGGYKGSAITGDAFCMQPVREDNSPKADGPGATPDSSVGHTGHTFWSGYKNVGVGGGAYQKVVGHFRQPVVSSTSNAAMLNWLGLMDGNAKSVLLQAGTVNDVSSPTRGSVFWEPYCTFSNLCKGILYPSGVAGAEAAGGSDVSVSVSFNPGSMPGPTAIFQVAVNGVLRLNITTQTLPSGMTTGGSAAYITERVTGPPREIFHRLH